jgi:hypothetical protein
MNSINLNLYNTLRKALSLSEEKSQNVAKAIQEAIVEKEIDDAKEFMSKEIKDIATKDFVKKEIAESKTEIIKWFIGMFIALALMVIGLYFRK